jgi:16S rRNA (guanine527-N7)-methyltransferase
MLDSESTGRFHVKHLTEANAVDFAAQLAEAGVPVDAPAQSMLLLFLDELITANQSINLTRITDPAYGVRLHLLDSLVALTEINEAPSGDILDLGSGGGIPGVPLAIATGRRTVLLDSVRKKGIAVAAILERLDVGPRIDIAGERAEVHALAHREEYAVVVARAVAPLPVLMELASPLLTMGGVLVALKGSPDGLELQSGRKAGEISGFGELRLRRLTLPGGDEHRTIVSATKVRASSVGLPRRDGLAKSMPLA